jgi:uncharacterized membrane protein YdjX (TVP38/TMEM64 family)
MIIQTIIVVIPSEAVIVFAGALGMDLIKTLIFGTLGLIAGSIIAFYISRYFGRMIVLKIIGKEWVDEIDKWISEHSFKAIMIARVVPLITFDLISYVAGLTVIDFRKYLLATIIGMIPRMIFLIFIGNTAGSILSLIGMGIDFILIGGTLGIIIIIYLEKKGHLGFLRKNIIKKFIKSSKK